MADSQLYSEKLIFRFSGIACSGFIIYFYRDEFGCTLFLIIIAATLRGYYG
jgi:hypothetical protein